MSANAYNITRFRAFAIHVGISITIFSGLLALLLGYWYKSPFFDLEDGPRAIQIIVFVDLVLGPLLTLIVFKPGKPGLKFDMSLIAIFQISALIYGIWIVQAARPVAVMLAYDALYIASYQTIKESDIPKDEVDKIIGLEPTYLYINLPKDQPGFVATVMKAFKKSQSLELLYRHAEPLLLNNEKQTSTIAIDIKRYAASSKEWLAILEGFMKVHKRSTDTTTFLPIKARYGKYFLAVDKRTGEIIDYLHIPYMENIGIKMRITSQDN